jgi:hypothetical protein
MHLDELTCRERLVDMKAEMEKNQLRLAHLISLYQNYDNEFCEMASKITLRQLEHKIEIAQLEILLMEKRLEKISK